MNCFSSPCLSACGAHSYLPSRGSSGSLLREVVLSGKVGWGSEKGGSGASASDGPSLSLA